MKLSMDFGRWTTTKAAMAIAGALAAVGAVGSALAISPTITPPIRWQGGWEAVANRAPDAATPLYTVPAGRSLIVTDIVIGNASGSPATFEVTTGGNASCNFLDKTRMIAMPVAPGSVVHLPLQAGIGFGPGQVVCINTSAQLRVSARGFLFTAN